MMEIRVESPRKPAAVRLLQVFGAVWILFGAIPIAIGAAVRYENLDRLWVGGFFFILAGLFALLAGWRRPAGLVAGVVSLSFMLVTLIGAIFVAIIGFLGAKDREQVRDYYSSGIPR